MARPRLERGAGVAAPHRDALAGGTPGLEEKVPVMPEAAVQAREAGAPKIDVRQLNAWFKLNHALRNVSLTVPHNSVLAIIGPSGCGKSTFVRCLNRMHALVPGAR